MNAKVEAMLRTETNTPNDPSATALREANARAKEFNFSIRNLSVLAYANGFTLWHYKANAHNLATTCAENYFAEASDMLSVGDLVMISAADGARIMCVSLADVGKAVLAPLT